MLLLSDEIRPTSRSDIAVVAMTQEIGEMDAMTDMAEVSDIEKKSEAEVRTIIRSTKMSSTENGRKTELHLDLEVRCHQTEKIDLLTNEDVHLKTTRPN